MGIHVLVVESNRILRMAIVNAVTAAGFNPVPMSDKVWAVEALTSLHFDMLVTGISPGDTSVPDLVKVARAKQPTLRIVVGSSYEHLILPARVVDHYTPVPCTATELRADVEAVLNKVRS